MKRLILATALGLAAAHANAASKVSIIDGDTFQIGKEKIRIIEIDAPESYKSRCENELVLGLKAKERLRSLLDAGPLDLQRDGKDRYGRTLAHVFAGGINVGDAMIDEGYALRYQPGADAKQMRLEVWCGARGSSSATEIRPLMTLPADTEQPAFYRNCSAVRAAGKAPLYRGQPGYSTKLDRDRDGVACE